MQKSDAVVILKNARRAATETARVSVKEPVCVIIEKQESWKKTLHARTKVSCAERTAKHGLPEELRRD